MKKRTISVMFAIAAAAALNMTAFAETKTADTSESAEPYTITLYANDYKKDGEIKIDVNADEFSIDLAEDNKYDSDSGIITWDKSNKTLTLDNVTMKDDEKYTDLVYISYPSSDGTAHRDFTVRLIGENTLHAGYRAIATAGIADLNLVAEDEATLDAKADNNAALMSNAEMTITGGSYTLYSGDKNPGKNKGIYAAQGLEITDAALDIESSGRGIHVLSGDTVLTGKDLSLTIDSGRESIYAAENLTIKDATINAKGTGIFSLGDITITDGNTSIVSDGYSIQTNKDITVEGGEFSIQSTGNYGIFTTDSTVSLNPDKLTAKSEFIPILVQKNQKDGEEKPSAGIELGENLKLSGAEVGTTTWLGDSDGHYSWTYFVAEGTEKDEDGLINYFETLDSILKEVEGSIGDEPETDPETDPEKDPEPEKKPEYDDDDDDDDDYEVVVSEEPVRRDESGVEIISGSWTQSEDGSWSFNGNDRSYQNEWGYIDNPYAGEGQSGSDWFRFDENGVMITGWFLDQDGSWYYMNPTSDGTKGAMQTGWQWIVGADGAERCYYLNPASDGTRGRLYVNTTTPDGFQVNADGAWIVDGKEQTR